MKTFALFCLVTVGIQVAAFATQASPSLRIEAVHAVYPVGGPEDDGFVSNFRLWVYVTNSSNVSVRLACKPNDISGGNNPDRTWVNFGISASNNPRGVPVVFSDADLGVVELRPNETALITMKDSSKTTALKKRVEVHYETQGRLAERLGLWIGKLDCISVLLENKK